MEENDLVVEDLNIYLDFEFWYIINLTVNNQLINKILRNQAIAKLLLFWCIIN